MAIEVINGRKVGVSRSGNGKPMLMLHCALAHRGALAPLMKELGAMSFTAFDLPGHGQSEFDRSTDLQEQTIETAITLLEESDSPSHLFGHSFGATVALQVALRRPDLVESLALYEPVYFSILADENPAAYSAEMADSASFALAARSSDWPNAARAFLSRWSEEGFDRLSKPQQAYILQTIPLIVASEPSIVVPESGEGVLRALETLQAPMALLEGALSPPVIAAINNVIAAQVPQVNRYWIEGAGHMGPFTHPRDVAKAVQLALRPYQNITG